MKRMLCLFLMLSLALCLFGCFGREKKPEEPVKFFYPRTVAAYGSTDGVIAWELREAAGHREDYLYLLEQYFTGPQSQSLTRGFPRSVKVKDVQVIGTSAKIELNDFASLLTGLDLNVACACLTATIMELTGAQTVTIRAESALLDGNTAITMTREQLLLWDDCTGQEEQ